MYTIVYFSAKTRGWSAFFYPTGHPLNDVDFDAIVTADGRADSLNGLFN